MTWDAGLDEQAKRRIECAMEALWELFKDKPYRASEHYTRF